jgi:eukaryotic translation initiation factor 2C
VELPADAYTLDRPDIFAARPKAPAAAVGQSCQLEVNSYRVTSFDFSKKVHQYSVSISPLPSKPTPVLKKIWAHPTFKSKFPAGVLERFIFDGRALAWASVAIPNGELRCMIDLDEGKDEPRKGGQAQFYITVKKSTEINMAVLDAYVKQKVSLDNSILETMTFFDHLLRATPSETLLAIKRNFYNPRLQGRPLMDGAVVEVHKGLYWSARISGSGIGLAINADVANTAFFVAQPFLQLVIHYMATQDRRLRGLNPVRLEQELRPVSLRGSVVRSEAFKQLRKLSKLKVTVNHAGRPEHLKKPIGIKDFTFEPRLGPEGSHARNNRFEHAGKTVTVEEYFLQKYNVRLQYPNLPLIDTGKGLIPMELATLIPMQRYPFKLGPDQVAGMIKIVSSATHIQT